MSSNTKTPVAMAVGAALVSGVALSGSAFAMQSLAQGYMLSAQEAITVAQDAVKSMHQAEGSHDMKSMDADKDGKLSKTEFAAAHDGSDAKFAAHDPDGDGFISAAEMDAHHAADGKQKAGTEGKCGEGKCGEGKCGGSL